MRRAAFIAVLCWGALAAAQEDEWVSWRWRVAPPPEALRAAVADIRERVSPIPGVVIQVSAGGDSVRIVDGGAVLEFPGPIDGVHSWPVTPASMVCYRVMAERFRDEIAGVDRSATAAGLGGQWIYALVALGFLFLAWRGGASWTSYYAFWLVGPTLIFALASQPLVLLLIPVALVLRRVLPDPLLWLRHAGRLRSLGADVAANPSNSAARRSLAMLWLDLRRPRRALPLVDEALAREPDDAELHFLRGQALLAARRPAEALDAFLRVLAREPKLRYGEGYLRGADALIALGRCPEAEEGLVHFASLNRSSVEGRAKLARVRRICGDAAGARAAADEAKAAYRDSPAFHRRKQLFWYLRAVVEGWRV